jgi:hypothetical protein
MVAVAAALLAERDRRTPTARRQVIPSGESNPWRDAARRDGFRQS